jgi:hypothetical protein
MLQLNSLFLRVPDTKERVSECLVSRDDNFSPVPVQPVPQYWPGGSAGPKIRRAANGKGPMS